jgi:hypothetical protein
LEQESIITRTSNNADSTCGVHAVPEKQFRKSKSPVLAHRGFTQRGISVLGDA